MPLVLLLALGAFFLGRMSTPMAEPAPAATETEAPAVTPPAPAATTPPAAAPQTDLSAAPGATPPAPPSVDDPPPALQQSDLASLPLPPNTPTADASTAVRGILSPIAGLQAKDVRDTFNDKRDAGARTHEAADVMAPVGTPLVAVVDGTVRKLFLSKAGGKTIYLFDDEEKLCYYYAHLDRYAEGLQEAQRVKRGDRIGYVGLTGNSPKDAPHLHFAVFLLGPEKKWWQGTPVNPYPFLMEAVKTRR